MGWGCMWHPGSTWSEINRLKQVKRNTLRYKKISKFDRQQKENACSSTAIPCFIATWSYPIQHSALIIQVLVPFCIPISNFSFLMLLNIETQCSLNTRFSYYNLIQYPWASTAVAKERKTIKGTNQSRRAPTGSHVTSSREKWMGLLLREPRASKIAPPTSQLFSVCASFWLPRPKNQCMLEADYEPAKLNRKTLAVGQGWTRKSL